MSEHLETHSSAHSHHSNYFKIWITLIVLLVISILGPLTGHMWIVLLLAFGIAIVKALMVAAYFMHLNIEKKLIWYILLALLSLMIFFFFAIAPDIMNSSGTNWRFI